MRFLIFNGVVIAALIYLFNADRTDLQSAADTAHAMIGKAGTAATQVVKRTRDLVTPDDAEPVEKVERMEPPAAQEPEVETVKAEPAPPPPPSKPEPVVKKVEPIQPSHQPEPVIETVESTPPPPPPAPEVTAGAPRRLDPPAPMESSKPETLAAKKPTRVASAEAKPAQPEARFIPERKTPTVDYEAATGRLPTNDPAVAKRQAEVLDGMASSSATAPTAEAKGGEYAIADGETLMTPRQRRKELDHLAEDMEFFFLEKLSR